MHVSWSFFNFCVSETAIPSIISTPSWIKHVGKNARSKRINPIPSWEFGNYYIRNSIFSVWINIFLIIISFTLRLSTTTKHTSFLLSLLVDAICREWCNIHRKSEQENAVYTFIHKITKFWYDTIVVAYAQSFHVICNCTLKNEKKASDRTATFPQKKEKKEKKTRLINSVQHLLTISRSVCTQS